MLSENDWARVSQAMRRMEEITLPRTLGKESITVKTLQVKRAWPVAMIVQVQYQSPGMDWVQNYESVEEARRWTARNASITSR